MNLCDYIFCHTGKKNIRPGRFLEASSTICFCCLAPEGLWCLLDVVLCVVQVVLSFMLATAWWWYRHWAHFLWFLFLLTGVNEKSASPKQDQAREGKTKKCSSPCFGHKQRSSSCHCSAIYSGSCLHANSVNASQVVWQHSQESPEGDL